MNQGKPKQANTLRTARYSKPSLQAKYFHRKETTCKYVDGLHRRIFNN